MSLCPVGLYSKTLSQERNEKGVRRMKREDIFHKMTLGGLAFTMHARLALNLQSLSCFCRCARIIGVYLHAWLRKCLLP